MSLFKIDTPSKPKTLYEFIVENIDSNGVYNGRDLPDTKPITENPPVFWPLGGKEGIILSNGIVDEPERAKEILFLLREALKNAGNIPALYAKAKDEDCMFYCVPLLRSLSEDKNLDYDALFDLALWFVMESTDKEALKFGLTLMMFFRVDKIELKDGSTVLDKLLVIGKCSEFTYYLLRILEVIDSPNSNIFDVTRHTTGWGRTFALWYLKPETPQIREWMLINGLKDSDHQEEVALDLAKKCDIAGILRQKSISSEIYSAITYIFDFFKEHDEFTDFDAWPEMLLNYFTHSVTHCEDVSAFATVQYLEDYILNKDNNQNIARDLIDKIVVQFGKIERKTDWNKQIYVNLCSADRTLSWCAKWLAHRRDLDVYDILFDDLQKHPEKDNLYCDLLKEGDPVRFGKVLEFAEQHIEEYLTGDYSPMFIIQELQTHPHQGEYIIERALRSPGYLHIPACLNVLEAWGVDYISKPIKDSLRVALTIEKNARSRQRIEKLLVHKIDDGGDFVVKID